MLDERDLQAIAQLMEQQRQGIMSDVRGLMEQQRQDIMSDVENLMDKKLSETKQSIMSDVENLMDKKLSETKQGIMSDVENLMDKKLSAAKQELKAEISHEIRALIEVDVVKDLKALAAGHALMVEQMAKRTELDEAKEVIHSLLDVLKIVVRQHSVDIETLKKAQ